MQQKRLVFGKTRLLYFNNEKRTVYILEKQTWTKCYVLSLKVNLSKTKCKPAIQQFNSLFVAIPKQRLVLPTPPQMLTQSNVSLWA